MTGLLLRGVRLVPVAGVAGAPAPSGLVDVRVTGDRVAEVAPGLAPTAGEEVVEADGRWLAPGLWDQHVHLGQWAQWRRRLDLAGTTGVGDALDRVRRALADRPPGGVLVGAGHRPGTWSEQPTTAALDAVAGPTAVVLVSGDGHHGWVSSAAARRLGAEPPVGVLAEDDWFPLYARIGDLPEERAGLAAAYRTVVEEAAARGVVGVGEFEFEDAWAAWPQRYAGVAGLLRVRAATYPEGLDAVLAAGLRTGDPLTDDGLVTMGPLKVISDGSVNTRTAACCEPWADPADPAHPHGRQNHPLPVLTDLLRRAHHGGLRAAVHAIGDAAFATALDAFAAGGAAGSVEHAQLVRLADLERAARLGVVMSVQPAHLLDDRDVTDRVWPDRAGRCFAFRAMADAGLRLVLGSDAPVAPLDPWRAMAAAVHRADGDDPPWHPEQGLTVAEALAASTDGQATVRAGSPGDLVLLDRDPLAGGPAGPEASAWLRAVRVEATVVAGRPSYRGW